MLKHLKAANQRGDTIVEVMVVLAVLGLAIGISFATANRSLLATKAAQENSTAVELLQGQLEQLRAAGNPGQPDGYAFCFKGGAEQDFTPEPPNPLTDYNSYPLGGECQFDNLYYISITYDTSDSKFTAKAYWDNIQGQGQDSATLVYRLYQ